MSLTNPIIAKLFKLAKEEQVLSNLSVGEPFEPVPEGVKQQAINSIIENKNKYSPAEGFLDLRHKLTEKVKSKNNVAVKPENILITSGVSGGYDVALLSTLKKNDEILMLDPYFVSLAEAAKILGFPVKFVSLYPDFKLDLDKVRSAITPKTKAIVLNSPSNPTGLVFNKEELTNLANLAKEYDFFIISDEIYEDFVYEGEHFSIGSIYEKTITLFGFSKSYSMTGWRLGYNVAPKEIIDEMIEIQRYLFYAPSTIAQYGAMAFDQVDISEKIKSFKEKRDFVLANLDPKFKITKKPQGAFYVFPELPEGISGEQFAMKALEAGVLVFPGSLFSQQDTHFRISYSVGMEELQKGIEILNSMKI